MTTGYLKIMPGYIALLTACLVLAGCSSKSVVRAKGHYAGTSYMVKRGDTLYQIARMSGNSVRKLAQINGIRAPYTIQVGQTLRLKNTSSGTQISKTLTPAKTRVSRQPVRQVTPVKAPSPGERCWIWPTQGNVITPFSSTQGGNKGIDIAGQRGQPIYATGAGRVVYAGDQLRGYGNLIMIKHDDKYITAYAHNQTLLAQTGEKVTQGQKIATMGSSGSQTVKLHFQLRYKATAIDPLRYLPTNTARTCR